MAPDLRFSRSGREDSNLRPLDPQSSALTKLRHGPGLERRTYQTVPPVSQPAFMRQKRARAVQSAMLPSSRDVVARMEEGEMGMFKAHTRKRGLALGAAIAAAVGAVAIVVPALASNPPPSALRLHLNSDGQYFAYGAHDAGARRRARARSTRPPEPSPKLSNGDTKYPGLVSNSIGVKRLELDRHALRAGRRQRVPEDRARQQPDRPAVHWRPSRPRDDRRTRVVKLTLEQSTSPYKKVTYQLQTGRSISTAQKIRVRLRQDGALRRLLARVRRRWTPARPRTAPVPTAA